METIYYQCGEQNRILVKRKFFSKVIPISAAVFIIGAGIAFVQFQNIAAVISIMLPAVFSMLWTDKMFFDSFIQSSLNISYVIENSYFIIKESNYERLKVLIDDIQCINHYQDNSIIMVFKTKKKIRINPYIDNYGELISALKLLCSFNEIHKNRSILLEYHYW